MRDAVLKDDEDDEEGVPQDALVKQSDIRDTREHARHNLRPEVSQTEIYVFISKDSLISFRFQ